MKADRRLAGTLAPLVTITATRVTGFSIYQKAKYWIDNVMENSMGVSPLNHVNMSGTYPTIYTNITFVTSGAISGAVMSLIMSKRDFPCVITFLMSVSTRRTGQNSTADFRPPGQRQTLERGAFRPKPNYGHV